MKKKKISGGKFIKHIYQKIRKTETEVIGA